jgi:hypothetical protein
MTDQYDEIDIELRPAGEISRRLTVLLATSRRLELEQDAAEAGNQDLYAVETDRFEISSWIRATQAQAITEAEQSFLRTPAGEASEEQLERHALDSACSVALAWVLGIVPDLGLDAANPATIELLREIGPKPWNAADAFRQAITLREESEVWQQRERFYLLRLRGLLDEVTDAPERRAAIQDVVADAGQLGLPVRDGDLVILAIRFADLDEDTKASVLAAADAYVHALTWACGFGNSWDDVQLDDL